MKEIAVHITPRLLEVMDKKKARHIALEVASSNASDFEVTELYLRFVSEKTAAYLTGKKRYQALPTERGLLLLPPYRLVYGDELTLDYESALFLHHITCKGVSL